MNTYYLPDLKQGVKELSLDSEHRGDEAEAI